MKVEKTSTDDFDHQNTSHAYSLQKSVQKLHFYDKTEKKTVKEDWERIK